MLIETFNKLNQLVTNDTNIELIEIWDRVLYLRMKKGKNKFHSKLGIKETSGIYFPKGDMSNDEWKFNTTGDKKIYRALLSKYHPDKNNGKYLELVQDINAIWEVYNTPDLRWNMICDACTQMNFYDLVRGIMIEDTHPLEREWQLFYNREYSNYRHQTKKQRQPYIDLENEYGVINFRINSPFKKKAEYRYKPGFYTWVYTVHPDKWKLFMGDIKIQGFNIKQWVWDNIQMVARHCADD